ncbi:hypothetical protein KIW84_072575, partial [Lathyrus oleraceus]
TILHQISLTLYNYIRPSIIPLFLIKYQSNFSQYRKLSMASTKSFITALLLVVTMSSTILEARQLLQTSSQQPNFPTIPSLPTTLPPLPSISSMPQASLPPLPTNIPSLPKLIIPPLPTFPTNIPTLNVPPLPAITSLPNIPTSIPTTFPSIPFLSPPPSSTSSP